MKKLLLLLFCFISFQAFSQGVVKLTDGEPAWVPNYLIVQGNLYFLEGTTYTSLGDSLGNYVRRQELVDSLGNYISRYELIDSLGNYISRLELIDTLGRYADTAWVQNQIQEGSQWQDITGGIEYPSGNVTVVDILKVGGRIGIGTSTPVTDLDVDGSIKSLDIFSKKFYVTMAGDTTALGTWKYYTNTDFLIWQVKESGGWVTVQKLIR